MTPLQELLTAFQKSGASDLHLTPDIVPYIRRYGELVPMPDSREFSADEVRAMTAELVGKDAFERFRQEKELDAAVEFNGSRLRVNLYFQRDKTAWSLRMLPSEFIPLERLGIPVNVLDTVCRMQKGLVLIAGATGSGKTTTLASLLHEINRTRHCHILTIEDPVEYLHQSIRAFVSQREIGSDTDSFQEALRRSLREDPDVVLIGEMRDQTTMRAALTLAETGHLTFGTLHTSEAVQTVTRVIGGFPANEQEQIRTQLATTLNLVICQQLIPWDDGNGRSLAAEIMVATPAVKAMIRENKIHQIASLIQTGQQSGMKTMNASILELVKSGRINPHRAVEWSLDGDDMKRLLCSFGYDFSLQS